jgi:multisubunit Na+/H+ antiporter MnhB subunit
VAAEENTPGGALVGCVFIASAVIAVLMAFGTVMAVTMSLLTKDSTNRIGLAILTGLTSAAVCAFFVMVSKRLYAAWRGCQVPHLIPPVLAVPLALAIGIGGIASMIASARMRSYSGAGASGTRPATPATWMPDMAWRAAPTRRLPTLPLQVEASPPCDLLAR